MKSKQFQKHLKSLEKRAGEFMRTDAPHHAANKAVEKTRDFSANRGRRCNGVPKGHRQTGTPLADVRQIPPERYYRGAQTT